MESDKCAHKAKTHTKFPPQSARLKLFKMAGILLEVPCDGWKVGEEHLARRKRIFDREHASDGVPDHQALRDYSYTSTQAVADKLKD